MNPKVLLGTLLFAGIASISPPAEAEMVWLDKSAETWAQAEATTLPPLASPVTAQTATPPDVMRILAATPETAFRLSAAGPTFASALPDIGLWKFINSVRAQQAGTTLVLLESNLRILEISSTPAAVPLPGAAWFMVMGLLGLAGVKATTRREPTVMSRAPMAAAAA